MQIRKAEPADAPAIARLIRGLAGAFFVDPTGAGAEAFLESIAEPAIAGVVQSPRYRYSVATLDDALAGVVAVRDDTHLYHLFVSPGLQGRGLGRRLWHHAIAQCADAVPGHPGRFTVNATLQAVGFYEGLGFCATGPRTERNGVAFVPMVVEAAASTRG